MLDKNITKIIDKVKKINDSCDFCVHEIKLKKKKVIYMYYSSTANDDKISDYLGKSLSLDYKEQKKIDNVFEYLKMTIPNSKLKIIKTYDEIFYYLSCGYTIVLVDGDNKGIAIETKAKLDRSITESTSEPNLKGPKDSFTENYESNIGLIRKRIKDYNLIFNEVNVGRRTKTKVSLIYIKDIASTEKVELLQNKLKNIDIDGIIDSNYIKELLSCGQASFLPRVVSTERPDNVSISLLNGKIAILVENSPFVLLLPSIFADFFKTSEDDYIKPFNATTTRIIRYIAFFIAILIPAFYIAVMTYNMEVLPNLLLTSFAIERESVPFPTVIEVLIMITAYEILKEADTRKPQIMGASISIVGALVLGDAAVTAGIISPIVVIVISLSAVSGMAFSSPDLVNAIRTWRLLFILSACMFGLVGIISLFLVFIAKASSLEVLGVPYFTPLAPFIKKDIKASIVKQKQNKIKNRDSYLTNNLKRIGDGK